MVGHRRAAGVRHECCRIVFNGDATAKDILVAFVAVAFHCLWPVERLKRRIPLQCEPSV